jgi:hypothetical protein
MSGVVDVGDAFTLTFNSLSGAVVEADWLDPDGLPVEEQVLVPESPPTSGKFPRTFTGTRAGMWTARFYTAGASEDYHVRVVSNLGQPPPLAAVGDVVAQYGQLTADEAVLTKYLLRAASKMIRQRVPNLDVMVTQGRLDADVVALAASAMVLRVLRNPEGLKAETTGPFSRTFDTSAAAGLLVLTDDDMKNLTPGPVAPIPSASWAPAATIRVTPGMVPAPLYGGWRGRY